MTTEERRAALDAIASEVIVCDRCRLSEQRTKAVPGEGSADTDVVFVGEGPGQNEDRQGRPFVGAAGTLLEQLLGLVGWRRDDVYITNIVKCRPPRNRDPEPDEIAACEPFLRRQLEVLDPALVVTLGRFSLQAFMPGDRIGRVHGTERAVAPATGARAATGYAMYHPAAALRQGALKETMQRDMAAIPEALIRARARRTPQAESAPANDVSTAPLLPDAAAPLAVSDPSAPPIAPAAAQPQTTPANETSDPPEEEPVKKDPNDQLGLF